MFVIANANVHFRKHRERTVSDPKVALSNMNAEMCIVLLIMLTTTSLPLWFCRVIGDELNLPSDGVLTDI